MRSQNFKFEKIPLLSFLRFPKYRKRKKTLKKGPKSFWDCLGDLTYKENENTNKQNPVLKVCFTICASLCQQQRGTK